jgi:molybdopterin-guanine dinucleotide biosynthesis protein A
MPFQHSAKGPPMNPDANTAIVLAGGRSSRMGADKAALTWRGTTMLQWIVAELGRRFEPVVVVASANHNEVASGLAGTAAPIIRDQELFEGPVKALRLGLATTQAEVAFVCACDLPFLNRELARTLCAMAAGHDAVIPLVRGRMQVLHAVYRATCLPVLDAMIGRGVSRLQAVVPHLGARIVNEDEMRAFDPELLSFFNVNTPEDYHRALQMAGQPR